MKIRTPLTEKQTFNDGILKVMGISNTAEPGKMPRPEFEERYGRVPYEKRTAGVKRLHYAKLEGVDISFVLRIPAAYRVSNLDACSIGDDLYQIRGVQLITDVDPLSQDLTLRKVDSIYDIAGISRNASGRD